MPAWLLLILAVLPGSLLGQAFSCNGQMFLALLDQAQANTALYAISPGSPAIFHTVSPSLGVPIHVIGYNVTDNHIYGFNTLNYQFYRINAAGITTPLGVPANLDTINFTYHAGDIGPNGSPFLLVARQKNTGFDARFYSIRFHASGPTASWVSVVSDQPVRLEDIAYDPILGEVLGYDSAGKRLVSVNTAGVVTASGFVAGFPAESMGALFFNRAGQPFGYGGGNNFHNRLYAFNRINGTLEGAIAGQNGRNSDGCACPYQLSFTKTVSPANILPCSEVRITYHFQNTAGIAHGQVRLTDTLPDGFIVTAIERPPFAATIHSGIGTSIFDASGMQVLLASDSVVIHARAGNLPPGRYGSQARASTFPLALGSIRLSDDPTTEIPSDTTYLNIIPGGDLLRDTLAVFCPGGSIWLRPLDAGQSSRWNTGDTTPILSVSIPGLYTFSTENACGIFRDSIRIREISSALSVSLGPDQYLIAGNAAQLFAYTNSSALLHYQWGSATGDTLSCYDCPQPQVQPPGTADFHVLVTDSVGCTATDTIRVFVRQSIPVFMPNAFSPNQNGVNDRLIPFGAADIDIDLFTVFDRWGGMVFRHAGGQINQAASGWDGTKNGIPMPPDVYLWVLHLRLPDGSSQILSGECQLLR